jgi:DNA invertase Pin-like site-specific DNA recombinase
MVTLTSFIRVGSLVSLRSSNFITPGALLRERVKAGMAQARRAGKRIGRPALRHFGPGEQERIRSLRTQGASVRRLAKDFATTQWMIAKLLGSPEAVESVAA